jgi:hypothetical protein
MGTVSDDMLRLPPAVMAEAKQCAEQDATTLEQFVAQAVMEKVAALKTHQFFAARRQRADLAAFDRFMASVGTEPPRPDDTVPSNR